MKAIVLGSSGAWPIPRPGCSCPQCFEARADPRLTRTRSGLYVVTATARVLVDASMDVCWQFEKTGVPVRVDRVVITHRHLDHILGLDDVVHVREQGDSILPVHANPDHRPKLSALYSNLLRTGKERIRYEDWGEGEVIALGDAALEGFETGHRDRFPTTGVLLHVPWKGRTARIAYATDMGDPEPSPRERLEDVDLFVGDGSYLGEGGYGHPGSDRLLEIAAALRAKCTVLTHVGHWQITDAEARRRLPPEVAICRDGDDLLSYLPDS